MKKLTLLIFLFIIWSGSNAQNVFQKKLTLKVSNLTTIYNTEKLTNPSYYNKLYSNSQFLKPTISLQWQKAKSYSQEIEITNIQINKLEKGKQVYVGHTGDPMPPIDFLKSNISIRYEFIHKFLKFDKKWQPEIGLALNPYFIQIKKVPQLSNSFPETNNYLGARLNLVPRINYFISKKVFIDLNIPINLYDFNSHSNRISNPSIEIAKQTQTDLESTFFSKVFNFRLGLGIKL